MTLFIIFNDYYYYFVEKIRKCLKKRFKFIITKHNNNIIEKTMRKCLKTAKIALNS